jgi:hypothetical protein
MIIGLTGDYRYRLQFARKAIHWQGFHDSLTWTATDRLPRILIDAASLKPIVQYTVWTTCGLYHRSI